WGIHHADGPSLRGLPEDRVSATKVGGENRNEDGGNFSDLAHFRVLLRRSDWNLALRLLRTGDGDATSRGWNRIVSHSWRRWRRRRWWRSRRAGERQSAHLGAPVMICRTIRAGTILPTCVSGCVSAHNPELIVVGRVYIGCAVQS